MSHIQPLLKNISWIFTGQIIAFIFGFFQMVYLARVLGPDSFGLINYSLVIVSYVIILSNLGLPLHGTRIIAKNRKIDPSYFWNVCLIRILISLPIVLCLIIVFILIGTNLNTILVQILFLFTIFPSLVIPDWVYSGLEKMVINSIVKILVAGIGFIFIATFVHTTSDIILIPIIQCFSLIIGLICGLIPIRHDLFSKNILIQPEKWIENIRDSISIGILNIFNIVMTADTFLIGLFLTPIDVGYYSASSRLISSFSTMLGLALVGFFPILCRCLGSDSKSLSSYSEILIPWIVFLEIPICLFFSINAQSIIYLLYHDDYVASSGILQILIWSIIPTTINSIYGWSFWAANRDVTYLKVHIVNFFTVLILLIIGIEFGGILGAAAAMVISGFIAGLYHIYPQRYSLPFPIKNVLILIISGIVPVFIFMYVFHFPLVISQLMIFGSFIAVNILFKSVPIKSALQMLKILNT